MTEITARGMFMMAIVLFLVGAVALIAGFGFGLLFIGLGFVTLITATIMLIKGYSARF